MADSIRLSDPVFDAEDIEELAQWIVDTMASDPLLAGLVSAGRIAAERYARTRAAQLLGMSLDRATGVWEPAKRAAYRVAEDLREKVQDLVSSVIERGESIATLNAELIPLFDQIEGRATMIARTESARALNAGTLAAFEEQGVQYVDVVDGDGCLPDGHDDNAPAPEPDLLGVVQADRQANGQVWTVEQAAELLSGHPNCTRVTLPRA